jgi:hypothetical protein
MQLKLISRDDENQEANLSEYPPIGAADHFPLANAIARCCLSVEKGGKKQDFIKTIILPRPCPRYTHQPP